MNKELLEILQKKKELGARIERAKTTEELKSLEEELTKLNQQQEVLVERARLASQINNDPDFGTPAPAPGKAPAGVTASKYDTPEYRNAFMKYVVSGGKEEIPAIYRAAGTTSTTDVGVVIPTTVMNRIIEKMEAVGMILPLVTRTNLKGGVSYPTATVKPVATWVAEGAGSTKQKKTITSVTFTYHKLRCAVAISLEVDQMALSAFEATIVENIAEAMAKALEAALISGSGEGQPKGILKEEPAAGQKLTLKGFEFTYADAIAAEGALPLAYENDAVYIMAKKTFMSFAGQTDQNGQPIAKVNYGTGGTPERYILGRRVICCEYLPVLDASTEVNKVVAFLFNMKDYALNTNYNLGLKKYEDNDTDDQIFKAIMLADGKVLDKNSLVTLQTPASKAQSSQG